MMLHTNDTIFVAILLASIGLAPLRAQPRQTSITTMKSAVEAIPIGATVKLRTVDGLRLEAVLLDRDASGIRVKPLTRLAESSRSIPYERLQAIVRYRDRVSVRKYALIGAAISGAAFAILLRAAR
jgi:hypothetical protein